MIARSHSLHLTVVFGFLLTVACTGDTATPADVDAVLAPAAVSADQSSAQIARAVGELRAQSAAWHNRAKAEDAGYTIDVGCSDERTEGLSAATARGMGYHTLNLELLDDEAHLLEPELLVYSLEPASGKMKLAGFDYFIPAGFYPGPASPDYPGEPPVLQGLGTPMAWNDAHDGWVAHAWPWLHNPDGMFENFNASVELCECEITPEVALCTP